jgi:uncharacterized protein with NAD-binding domain and iron-sulfur cluster
VVAACDVPGIQKLLPEPFRKIPQFDNIYKLEAVPVTTVQLRFDGWVTEMQDPVKMKEVRRPGKRGNRAEGELQGVYFDLGGSSGNE